MARGTAWGRLPVAETQAVVPMRDATALPATPGTRLPYGNGRSYGDSCLDPGGTLLDVRPLDRFIAFDPATGALRCQAGVTLGEILDLVVPQGWFLPVTPGTCHATVGGALANDVHGKNHHRAGTFGHHVSAFTLLRSDRPAFECLPGDPLFAATVGGLGLTGVVTGVALQLRRVPGPWLESETIRFDGLDDFFALSAASARSHEYTVAWIDCLARGTRLGRGHFIRADHATSTADPGRVTKPSRLAIPFTPPLPLVNRLTLRPFNTLYYHRQRARTARSTSHFRPYFYPLDGIRDWNRMYGPRGFLQHQCVLPPAHADAALRELLSAIAASGQGSFLAVLKEFGARPSLGMLSFPRPGTTLALDFADTGDGVRALLDRLDAIVAAAGGAVYPAKDARMSGALFRSAFPAWQDFSAFVDPTFSSGFWRRVME